MTRQWARPGQSGFTLIEVLVSILIFSLVTLGITPVLLGTMRAAGTSRSATIGKNIAVEAMERVRGLPYYVEYSRQKTDTRHDVLDFYFPDVSSAGYNSSTKTYTTACTAGSAGSNPACNLKLHPRYTVTFQARFVTPSGSPPSQTYSAATPAANYNWRYDVASGTPTDVPPSRLLEMIVRTSWSYGSRSRSVTLTSYVGDRKATDISVLGEARIDYGVQVLTTYVDSAGRVTDLTVRGGAGKSTINQRLTSSSGQVLGTGEISLVDRATGSVLINTATARPSQAYNAPPDNTPTSSTTSAVSFDHPTSGVISQPIAGLDAVRLQNSQVTVANEVPLARGEYSYPAAGGSVDDVWVNNQPDLNGSLKLDRSAGRSIFSARTQSSQGLMGATRAQAFQSPSLQVESIATVTGRDVQILPVANVTNCSISSSNCQFPSSGVVRIDSFSATTRCVATGYGSPVVSVTWSATLSVWVDTSKGNKLDGAYRTITLGNSGPTTLRAALVAAGFGSNPLVWDGPQGTARDVYMFEEGEPGTTSFKRGYFVSWDSFAGTQKSEANGRITSATLDGAMRIVTTATTAPGVTPSYPESGLKISVAKMSCRSEDRR